MKKQLIIFFLPFFLFITNNQIHNKIKHMIKFGKENVHHIDNLVKVSRDFHYKITGHYNSKMPGTNMTVRQYLSSKSFQEQFEYGMKIFKKFNK